MKHVIIVIFITVIFSISLFAESEYHYCTEPYSYFIYNEASLTQEQLSQIIQLKNEYYPKISNLRKKIYLEKTKMNLEMSKKNPDELIINKTINLNMEYNKELKELANEFLQKYHKIKNSK